MTVKIASPKLSRQQVSILLTIIALVLWSHSILHARFEIGYLGLIHGLPGTFFIALTFLTVASAILWVSKEKHGRLLCLQLLILVSALWLVPAVTGGSPPLINHDYRNFGLTDFIGTHGYFSPEVLYYFSWPGTFITSAIATEIALVNLETLFQMGLGRLFMQLLCLAPLYVFLRNALGESRSNYYWLGCWLFYLAQWVTHVQLSPQGFGFFFLLTLLALVTSSRLWQKGTNLFVFLSLILVVFAALVVTHLITSLAFLCILIGLCLVRRDKRMAFAVAGGAILLATWNLTGAGGVLGGIVQRSEEFVTFWQTAPDEPTSAMLVLDPGLLVEREITGRMTGSQSHITLASIRVLLSSIFALIGLAGAILVCRFRRNLKLGISLLIITLAPLILLSLSYHYVALLPRLYLLALPGMACFGAMLLDMKNRMPMLILCLLLIISCPLHVICRYGNQELDYFPPGQLSGATFFHNKTTGGYVLGAWPVGIMKDPDRYWQNHLSQVDWEESKVIFERPTYLDLPCYIGVSRQDEKRYELLQGNIEFIGELKEVIRNDINYAFIYHNPDLELYVSENLEEWLNEHPTP